MNQDKPNIFLVDGVDFTSSVKSVEVAEADLVRLPRFGTIVPKYRSLIPLECKGDLESYLREKWSNHGPLAESNWVYKKYNHVSKEYEEYTGKVDFLTFTDLPIPDDEYSGLSIDLLAETEFTSVENQDQIVTNLLERKDFTGNSIEAFGSETQSVELTPVDIPNRSESGGTTNCEMVLIWEVLLRLFQKISGRNDCFRSSILGRTDGEVFTYPEDGKWSFIGFSSEQLVRQGSSSNYGIKTSLEEIFEFLYNLDPVALGVEIINGSRFYVLEKIDYFHDTSEVIWTIENPSGPQYFTNPDFLYSQVLTGFRTYSSTQDVGNLGGFLYTSWTKRSYVTPMYNKTENSYIIRTNIIVDPYLIQIVKETPISESSASTLTNRIFAFWLKRKSGGGFKLDKDYLSSGFNNPSTIYNLKFLPARTLHNHLKLLSIITKKSFDYRQATEIGFPGLTICQFEEGDGDVQISTQLAGESGSIQENEDKVHSGNEPIFLPDFLELEEIPVSEEEIRNIRSGAKKIVQVISEGTTRDYWIEEFTVSKNRASVILKERNKEYTN